MGPISRVGTLSRRNTCSGMTDVLLRLSYTQLLPAPFPAIRHIHERHPCRCRLHGLCHDRSVASSVHTRSTAAEFGERTMPMMRFMRWLLLHESCPIGSFSTLLRASDY